MALSWPEAARNTKSTEKKTFFGFNFKTVPPSPKLPIQTLKVFALLWYGGGREAFCFPVSSLEGAKASKKAKIGLVWGLLAPPSLKISGLCLRGLLGDGYR